MICPICQGAKKITGFATTMDANGYRRCNAGFYNCFRCRGAGEITEEHAERIKQGEALRQDRLARGNSLFDEARERSMSPAELSELEHGGKP